MMLKPSSSFILLLISLVQTCNAANHEASNQAMDPGQHCTSSCGLILNISFPFRLKKAPKLCGYPQYELECENNATFLYLNSQKYRVKAINYANNTIRLVDDSVDNHNACSFPNYPPNPYDDFIKFPFSTENYPQRDKEANLPINLISCPHALNESSSFFTDANECAPNTYIKVGHMNVSSVPYACTLDLILITSWNFNDLKNVSLSEINHSLLYGFELSWFMYPCSKCRQSSECHANVPDVVYCEEWVQGPALFLIAVLIVVFVISGISIPAKIILGIICFLGLPFLGRRYWGFNLYSWIWYLDLLQIEDILQILLIYSVIRFIIMFPCLLWFLIYKFRRRHMSMFDAIERFLRSDNKLMPIRYSYSDIKKMTKGFQEVLGQGGYGSVYKGRLRSGHHVAVKLLQNPRANGQDFMNEIATIGRIHHVNIVKLVGYCAEGSKRVLIYDYMPKSSLEKYIFSRDNVNSLDWDTKFKIAVGVARGIEYLHQGCHVQILHFDIKPHNILLDEKFTPKISDFGLAKLCSKDKNAVTMTAVRGTIGYVAPELMNRGFGEVSYKADVYSFGMLLIEMVGLKKDLQGNNENSSQYFPDWIYGCFDQGKDIEFEMKDEDDKDGAREIGRKMTIVALWCIQMRPDDRPSMNKVVEMLEGEIENLQIPECPAQSSQVAIEIDESLSTFSTDSMSLLHHDAAAPRFEITVEL